MIVCTAIALLIGLPQGPSASPTLRVAPKTTAVKREGWYETRAILPSFSPKTSTSSLVEQTLSTNSAKILTEFRKEVDEYEKPERPYEAEYKTDVTLAHPRLVSTLTLYYWYTGGAHPNSNYLTHSVGILRGKATRLNLADLFLTGRNVPKLVNGWVMPRLREMQASAVLSGSIKGLESVQLERFAITPNGITWAFPPYDVGSYAEGSRMVKIPWSVMRKDLNPKGPLAPIWSRIR